VSSSLFWYDYETTGIDPRRDRPLQVAGIRTDENLNEIGEPLNIYCQPSEDILPHPAACLVTGITPGRLAEQGLSEAEFMTRIHAELAQPGTCGVGYNSLRFDDEVTRYSLYRNFFDPYAREWQGGNSRWDLIDLVRCAYALRPEGIVWPEEDGRVTLKLERLTAANGIAHGQAHDALSDVRATTALARAAMCRNLAHDADLGQPAAAFTVGLLSILDALLQTPMDQIIPQLPLDEAVGKALLERQGPYGPLLTLVLDYERGDWAAVEQSGLDPAMVREAYLQALVEVQAVPLTLP
jgi:DNA polymerase III epsilon subunit-like protein